MRIALALAVLAASTPAVAAEILHNYAPLCPEPSALGPGPGEEGHVAATRLVPSATPFTVTTVRAKLHHGQIPNAQCDASGPHRMELWVSDSEGIDPTPTVVAALTFGPEEVLGEERILSATLDTPVVLEDGQALFVSIDFGGTHPQVGCVATCRSHPAPGTTFWSGADHPPYDWRPLQAFGIEADLWIEAVGTGPATETVEAEAGAVEMEDAEGAPEADAPRERRRRRR